MILTRLYYDDDGTIGILYGDDGKPVTLISELPDKGNKPGKSRIPAGKYSVTYLERSASGRFKRTYLVNNVPGRTGILFHSGNFTGDKEKGKKSDSYGCLLPCSKFGILSGQRAGLQSKSAMNRIRKHVGKNSFTLEIRDESY